LFTFSRISFLSVFLLFILSNQVINAQQSVPLGTAKLIDFTNTTASFSVPEGKTWVVYSIFSDLMTGGVLKYDDYNKKNYIENSDDIRILIKSLNGIEKTNIAKNIFGTQLYRSTDDSRVIPFPIILPEKTTLSLVIFQGDPGNLKEFNGTAYISLMEIDNKVE
jgi:hypothetical protein